jgi:3-phosphoshikimate 1-carboxyvinyltransferase
VDVRVETDVEHDRDAISITPPRDGIDLSPNCKRVEFDTYDDHRMAMSMALIGLRRPNCFVRDPACVRKTYPGFWGDLAKLYD